MTKALKVVLIIYGVVEILFGLGFILFPQELSEKFGFEKGPDYVQYILALLGFTLIAISVFLIAAARDPIRHISWVKFAVLWAIAGAIAGLYAVIRNYVEFGQAGMGIVMDAVLAVALLICYPWRGAPSSE